MFSRLPHERGVSGMLNQISPLANNELFFSFVKTIVSSDAAFASEMFLKLFLNLVRNIASSRRNLCFRSCFFED